MKYLLSIFFFSFSFIGFAQKSNVNSDTIFFKNGNSYSGVFVIEDVSTYQFLVSNSKKVSFFSKDSVLKISKGISSVNSSNVLLKDAPLDSLTNENLLKEFKKLRLKTDNAGYHLQSGAAWGIGSGLLMIGGTAMALAGVLTGKPIVSYTGAGIAGLGLVFTIPAFANVGKAGKYLRN